MEDVEPPSLSNRCQVQLELKNIHKTWPSVYAMNLLTRLDQDRKFLFDSGKRRKYGYDKDCRFMFGCNWEDEDIEVEEPEYTPSTHIIKFNFIMSLYPFPEQLIEILRSNGWTVTGRYRMGLESPTTHKIDWGPWDYQLHEEPKRAALLADLEQLDKDTAKLDRGISDCQALLAIMPIFPQPPTREAKMTMLSRTLADFRRRLDELVYAHSDLFRASLGGGHINDFIEALRHMQLTTDISLHEQVSGMFITFIFCCQCVFSTDIIKDVFVDDIAFLDMLTPREPFLSEFRRLFAADKVFKAEWMRITRSIWESMQYMDSAPTSSDFMALYPFHDALNEINASIATHESKKTELQTRRRDVLRNLAHLHAATAGRGSPSNPAPQHADPDGAGPSNKRKLDQMATLLERWVIG